MLALGWSVALRWRSSSTRPMSSFIVRAPRLAMISRDLAGDGVEEIDDVLGLALETWRRNFLVPASPTPHGAGVSCGTDARTRSRWAIERGGAEIKLLRAPGARRR